MRIADPFTVVQTPNTSKIEGTNQEDSMSSIPKKILVATDFSTTADTAEKSPINSRLCWRPSSIWSTSG